jgi:diguanylate cyclase (GGDEF)-like protein
MMKATSGLRSLAAMAHLLARKHDLNDVLETAAEQACAALGAATVSISRLSPSGEFVSTIVNVGDLGDDEQRWPEDETYAMTGHGRLSSAIRDKRTWVDSLDDPDCPVEERELLESLGKGCSLATAIVVAGHSWGEFYATRHVGAPVFDEDAVAYAEVLVAILGAAVSSSIRETTLEELAFHDPLTGLLNRRALDEEAVMLFDLGDQQSREIAVVAIDINELKLINDTEGHARGDQVIKAAAAALTRAFEPLTSSVVARAGGDEFTVLVSGPDVADVEHTVNALCREASDASTRVGLSAGISKVVLDASRAFTMSDVFAAADRALYVAKRMRSSVAVVADDISV